VSPNQPAAAPALPTLAAPTELASLSYPACAAGRHQGPKRGLLPRGGLAPRIGLAPWRRMAHRLCSSHCADEPLAALVLCMACA